MSRYFFLSVLSVLTSFASPASQKRVVLPKTATPLHYSLFIAPQAEHMNFEGAAKVEIKVEKASKSLVLNAADLTFKNASIEGVGNATLAFDKTRETVTFSFKKALNPGVYTLNTEYSGKIFKSASGLFALDYPTKSGTQRSLYTQFENSDARRVFPCFDEPEIKSTFELSVKVPEPLMPVSNMPIASSTTDGLFKTVRFERTPKMSTYLLFFALGDFERVTRSVNDVEVGVIVKKGDTLRATFALDAAAQLLPFYEEYFGVKYPLPKLDLVAAPGTSQFFSAMENWGAIFYFDRAVLIDNAISTEQDRRYVFLVIAHEMAHQWFGNLVTMAWWDDLWLNEGFATWMEVNATNHFHPEWKPWLILREGTSSAMALDSKEGTHPVIQPILDVLQASQAFDSITYEKGAAVIRMLEAYAGVDAFRAGLRAYMKKYAYKNAMSDDLWTEIDAKSTRKVMPIARDFTLKAGVPLIDVSSSSKRLSQSVFVVDDSTPRNQSWQVPVDIRDLNTGKTQQLIVSRQKPISLVGDFLVDPQLSGYYLTRYDDKSFEAILTNFDSLSIEEQLGVIANSFELGLTGFVPMSRVMRIAEKMTHSLNHLVLNSLVDSLAALDHYYTDLNAQPHFRSFAVKFIKPILSDIGWTAKASDTADTPKLRAAVITTLGRMRDREVVEQANGYFANFIKDNNSLSAELRDSVLGVVASQGNEIQWQQILKLAMETNNIVERGKYYNLLTRAHDTKIANKVFELALAAATPLTIAPDLVRGVASHFPKMALDFVIKHQAWLEDRLETSSRTRFVPGLLVAAHDASLIPALNAYAKKHIPKTAMQAVKKTVSSIKLNADIRKKRIAEINSWLNSRP